MNRVIILLKGDNVDDIIEKEKNIGVSQKMRNHHE
jgi:hypothetical protein